MSARWRTVAREGLVTLGGYELSAYVITDGKSVERVLSARAVVGALTSENAEKTSGAKYGNLDRLLSRLQPELAAKAAESNFEFDSPTGPAHGYRSAVLADICDAYVAAALEGKLRASQRHLARNAHAISSALARVGLDALIDEATGYQSQVKAGERKHAIERYLRDQAVRYERLLCDSLIGELCRLHGYAHDRAKPPRFVVGFVGQVYADILGPDLHAELQQRSGQRREHSWLKPDVVTMLVAKLEVVEALARTSLTKADFRSRYESVIKGLPHQYTLLDHLARKGGK